MTKKLRVALNLAIAGPLRSGAAVAPGEERCADLHAPRGAALCLTRLRVWQKSRGRGGKSPALLVSSILNVTRYYFAKGVGAGAPRPPTTADVRGLGRQLIIGSQAKFLLTNLDDRSIIQPGLADHHLFLGF